MPVPSQLVPVIGLTARPSSATSCFADYGGPFHVFQIVGELLRPGESVAAGEHIKINVSQSRTLDTCLGPELLGRI